VTILEPGNEIGKGLVPTLIKPDLLHWLREKGVKMITGVNIEQITEKTIIAVDESGQKKIIEADRVITALPLQPDNEIIKSLAGNVPEIYVLGDCKQPGLVTDAIEKGASIGRRI